MKEKSVKQPTVAALMAEIEALRKRVAELEGRPPVVIHNHPPHVPVPTIVPNVQPVWPQPFPGWKPGDVFCGITTAAPAVPWNGPRNPDGSCAPLGSATLTCHGGGSRW